MLRLNLTVKAFVLVAAMMLMGAAPSFAHEGHDHGGAMSEMSKGEQLRDTMRDLWMGHVFWVRNVALMTRLGDKAAAKVAEEQVVANAHAIANAVGGIYGQAAGEKVFPLLAGHYGAVKDYMKASYAGNRHGKDAAAARINANANELATFLSSANPNWPKETLVSLLIAHGGHHMAQIDEFARKDYRAEAQTWEAMKKHMLAIADALADGIEKQFPGKF
jgi:hypothetical protein